MSLELRIGSPESSQKIQASLNKQEWNEYSEAFMTSGKTLGISSWACLLIPVRVHHLNEFCEDLFLPSTIHIALRMKKLSTRIFLTLGSILLDVISFPVRLLTSIPWKILSPKKEKNHLFKFLVGKNVPQEVLKANYVKVKMKDTDGQAYYGRIPLVYMPARDLLHPRSEADKM